LQAQLLSEKGEAVPRDETLGRAAGCAGKLHPAVQPVQSQQTINFARQGGEPMPHGLNYLHCVVELERKHASDRQIENAIPTNAITLMFEWAEFLIEDLGVLIDGWEHLHDIHESTKSSRLRFSV
jgi:sulfatase maturation enzyme AslB (radical SAM superfamily)